MFMSLVDDLVTKNNLEGLELWTGPQIRIFLSYLQGGEKKNNWQNQGFMD